MATATQIHDFYRQWDDTSRTHPVVEHVAGGRVSTFTTQKLEKFRSFVLSVGGCGLSGPDKEKFWDTVVTGEREALHGTSRQGPMETAFPTAASFTASLRDDADRCMQELDWRGTPFDVAGKTVHFYSRDLMKVLVETAESATKLVIKGERRKNVDGDVVRTGTLDSDLYLNEQESVMNIHGKNGAGKCFVMAVQLFSDAALVSWSGGKPTMSRSAAGRLQFG